MLFDEEQMWQVSQDLHEAVCEIQSIITRVDALVRSVHGEWQGASEQAYEEKLNYVKEQFAPIYLFWEECSRQIAEQAKAYQEHEEKIYRDLQQI